jgi:large subunit ribosomal protein L4
MSKIPLKNVQGDSVGDYEVADNLLVLDRGDHTVHEAVVAYQANQRTGSANTLSKWEVNGSGKKPWKQKGLGRARAGYKQSNVWRGGYVAHGPQPRDFSKRLTKKAAKLAFRRAFSAKIEQGEVTVIDELVLSAPKTKEFTAVLKNLGLDRGGLFIVAEANDNLLLASRNIPRVELVTAKLVNIYQVLRYKNVIVTKAGMEALEQRLA